MVTVRLTGRKGTEPILSIKQSISIDTMINFDGDGDGHGDGDGTCKQAFRIDSNTNSLIKLEKNCFKENHGAFQISNLDFCFNYLQASLYRSIVLRLKHVTMAYSLNI